MTGSTARIYVSVIIPAYNEERRLPASLDAINAFLDSLSYPTEVIVADDGSVDSTARIVEETARRWPRTHLLRLHHLGKGHAVKQGMLAARGEYLLMCDADLSVSIEELPRFLPPQVEADIVIGSREGPRAERLGEPWRRHVMGRVFNRVVAWITGLPFADTQCGFKVFHGDTTRRLFGMQRVRGFGFDVELLYLAQRQKLRVAEVPIVWRYGQESRVQPWRHALAMLWEALSVRWSAWRKH